MWVFRSIKEFWGKGISKGSIFIMKIHDIIKVTSTKVIKWVASYKRLDHSSSPASKHVLYNFRSCFGWDWENVLGKSEETFSTCLLPKSLWCQFLNSNWKHNSSFLACFPRDSSSINRRGHWRSNARFWNTKQLSLSKQNLSNLFNISFDNDIYLSLRTSFWVCISTRIVCLRHKDPNNILHIFCLRR